MPVIAPPRNAAFSAGGMPPRAASATRQLARTETFIPMKPAAADSAPPSAKPTATSMLCSGIRTTNRTAPTMPIVVYWRRRYAEAPSCTAFEISTMRSLPGERANSDLAVSAP